MAFSITKKNRSIKGEILLPASKSESARLLIIDAILGTEDLAIENLSDSTDTQIMQSSLESLLRLKGTHISLNLDIQDSGTTMRFITAYASNINVKSYITGSDRMKERPLGILVEKLQELGTSISYMEKEGFPPIRVEGKRIKGGEIEVDATVSSQFISALLLLAPKMTNGLKIKLIGKVSSAPYIQMTIKIMREFGIVIEEEGDSISIEKQRYQNKNIYRVESDWSAAAYWYQMVAFSDDADIVLLGLKKDSTQGDCIIAEWAQDFGVKTTYTSKGVLLTKTEFKPKAIQKDFYNYPDLAQMFITTATALQMEGNYSGLRNLRFKETDRLEALKKELSLLGAKVTANDDSMTVLPSKLEVKQGVHVYADHRMAMAFAPLSMLFGPIKIDSPTVVAKSYPKFWKDLESVGFELKDL